MNSLGSPRLWLLMAFACVALREVLVAWVMAGPTRLFQPASVLSQAEWSDWFWRLWLAAGVALALALRGLPVWLWRQTANHRRVVLWGMAVIAFVGLVFLWAVIVGRPNTPPEDFGFVPDPPARRDIFDDLIPAATPAPR